MTHKPNNAIPTDHLYADCTPAMADFLDALSRYEELLVGIKDKVSEYGGDPFLISNWTWKACVAYHEACVARDKASGK